MKRLFRQASHQMQRRTEVFAAGLLFVFMFVVGVVGVSAANAGSPVGGLPAGTSSQGAADAPLVQQFEDVPDSNIFSSFINNLYVDNIIGGYACGSTTPPEPCIPPTNRPYYRPNNNVTRAQMAKYADLARRNIADALGHSLVMTDSVRIAVVISSTTTDSLDVNNASGAEAVQSICTRANQNCWAFYSSAATGDFAGVYSGGRGVNVASTDSGYPALDATANSATTGSYAVSGVSENRGGYFKSNNTGLYSLYVDTAGGPTQGTAGLEVNGSIRGEGNLYIAGSKAGYVADIMQNVDSAALEAGDVVTIMGNSAPVLGQIPAVTVKKASTAYDSGVVGVVDQVMYVPDAATKAAYDRQEAALRAGMDQRSKAMAAYKGEGDKPDPGAIDLPQTNITDAQGTLHADTNATQVRTNGYATVVTLGSYKGVKVDASFGPVHAGDLLTTSPHAGYAMVVTDKVAALGAVIGKALGNLDSGTGLVPVMVTLK